MVRRTTWFTLLLDVSLARRVTSQLARAAYALALTLLAILGLIAVIYGAMRSLTIGVLVLVVTAVAFLLCVVLLRLWLGAVVALSRIEEHTEEMAEQMAGVALNTAPDWEPVPRARVESPSGNTELE